MQVSFSPPDISEQEIAEATEKMAAINSAYEQIMKQRKAS